MGVGSTMSAFAASIEASTKGGLMSGPVGQRLAKRNIAIVEPQPWGVNHVPLSQGGTLQ